MTETDYITEQRTNTCIIVPNQVQMVNESTEDTTDITQHKSQSHYTSNQTIKER